MQDDTSDHLVEKFPLSDSNGSGCDLTRNGQDQGTGRTRRKRAAEAPLLGQENEIQTTDIIVVPMEETIKSVQNFLS